MPTQQTPCEKTVSGSTRSGYVPIAVAPSDETRVLGVAIPVVGGGALMRRGSRMSDEP